MPAINLDRASYKKIKGMDKKEMNSYLNEICNLAYNRGISDMSKELAKRVDAGIRNWRKSTLS